MKEFKGYVPREECFKCENLDSDKMGVYCMLTGGRFYNGKKKRCDGYVRNLGKRV